MNLEIRYSKSFLLDLKSLEPAAYERVYNFVFVALSGNWQLHHLPELRRLDQEGIFYRFTLDEYLIGIELRGEIVKFLRVVPMPEV
ncbi:hypothetical protein B6N60_02624 [Richelia sinica FACHB-800]|uniref:Cytotoxic translational repressor of toxin-antitoxin stability system n=1 Tax=Richelia sinica FACHB-800 TaxID=1357546 RepID=A0A975T9G8_9NOST|nr:cytotoxic translational repressor of toxin-antitoxin stability system [Richelia sinica]MBD2666312.1 cytotoxic translational repressor of toxin-antitoxin stability system [Richelia sinica FACHB-800]QXE23927.1 hypothetical protein B6N60_02624 [Richelia sinica FACHB-800]